ncbi:MAG: type IV pilus secretin PilQ [Gammaproteobacteria bacterium]|nr:type IV pilus secretin PilQ [Gammaproteobacteria bacterium]
MMKRNSISLNLNTLILQMVGLCLLLLSLTNLTYANTSNTLDSISYKTLPGNRVQIALKLSGPAEKPGGFSIDNPARIALDLANTKSNLASKVTSIGLGNVRSLIAVNAGNRTRAIINLTIPTPYTTQVEGNTIFVTLDAPKASHQTNAAQSNLTYRKSTLAQKRRSLKDLDFRRGAEGEGRVVFTLSESGIPTDIREKNGKIFVEFLGTELPKSLARRIDVLDFATPIRYVSAKKSGKNTQVIIEPTGRDYEQLAYQTKNLYTIELKHIPKEELDAKIKEKFGYTGERLSLNFQDIEVRSVLQLLADFTNLNVVVSDTVEGKLTLRLKNVPWDQALDIILKTKGLDKRESGNVLLIAPTEEIAARERIELEAHQQIEELAPLRTAFIQVNYAKAIELAEILKSEESSILSERATVTTDERTNTLLVHDTDEKLEEIRRLIAKLDIPVRQVLIESRIVIATDDFNKELGVRFGVNRDTTNDGSGIIVSGNRDGITNLGNNDPLGDERFNVNLPAASAAGSLSLALAKMPFGSLLELELSAMQAEGRGEVISSPRVITSNQREALIEQGVEIPYLEASSSGAATISFRKAVLALRVTPQITPDNRIIMDLTVNKDSVGELYGEGRQRIPSIDTREVQTQVLVSNGDTVVLGGIYEQAQLDEVVRVPFLSDLPLVGRLFRNTKREDDKTELLVFVTPKIVKDNSLLSN